MVRFSRSWCSMCKKNKKTCMCFDQALDTEKRLREVQEGSKTTGNLDPVPTNDLEYEDKQKTQDSQLVYDCLRFNLAAQNSKEK